MARQPARQSFAPLTSNRHELATADFPDMVSINLDGKDPNEVTIVEVDDIPEDDRGYDDARKADWTTADQPTPRDVGPRTQKRIDRLKAETETQRRLREAADRERDAAIEAARALKIETEDLRRRLDSGGAALANSMKAERESRLADAKRRYAQASSDGDGEAAAEAMSDVAAANAELVQIAARTPAPRAEPEVRPAPAAPQQQQRAELKPNVAAWIAGNDTWFGKDKTKTDTAYAISRAVIARGIRDDSPEYTQELDKGLKAVYPDHQPHSGSQPEDGSEGEGRSAPRRTNAVAEGTRENPGQKPNPRIVELSSSQLAIAKQLNLTPQQYAASVLKLAKQNGA
ncbi:MAG: hypothetical protein WC829_04470 [Hyphomicrobium sp.]|jgi:hypothetical protein